jgi:hypothetical protein
MRSSTAMRINFDKRTCSKYMALGRSDRSRCARVGVGPCRMARIALKGWAVDCRAAAPSCLRNVKPYVAQRPTGSAHMTHRHYGVRVPKPRPTYSGPTRAAAWSGGAIVGGIVLGLPMSQFHVILVMPSYSLIPVPPHLRHLTTLPPFLRVPFPSQFLHFCFFCPVFFRTLSSKVDRRTLRKRKSGKREWLPCHSLPPSHKKSTGRIECPMV